MADSAAAKASAKPLQATVKHPDSGDVRVVPIELLERYLARGFEKA